MDLLLDTHIALWTVADSHKLSKRQHRAIGDPDNRLHVSIASLWEIAIKHSMFKGRRGALSFSSAEAQKWFATAGMSVLPISADHVAAVETLPALHADPFDRMLVAQATVEGLRLITNDCRIATYFKSAKQRAQLIGPD